MKRPGSTYHQLVQRIPANVAGKAVGLKLSISTGDITAEIGITPLDGTSVHPCERGMHAKLARGRPWLWRTLKQSGVRYVRVRSASLTSIPESPLSCVEAPFQDPRSGCKDQRQRCGYHRRARSGQRGEGV
jgi:hypothetical protein